MSLIVVGLNHRTAPVDLLERMTVPEAQLAKVLHDLAGREHLLEVVVLSHVQPHRGLRRAARTSTPRSATCAISSPPTRARHPTNSPNLLYTYYDDAAVAHLFSVAAGLDSMIVGESEILGQVREAWQAAVREATAPQLVADVPARGRVGQARAHRDGHRAPSGVDPVGRGHGGRRAPRHARQARRCSSIGAGQMGTGLASTLRSRASSRCGSRTARVERGEELAAKVGGGRDPAHRDRRHARRRRRGAVVDRVDRSAHRTLDDRDGDGVPRRPPAADRRRGAAARRRSRCARGQRRDAARPRRPQGLRAAIGRAPPQRDRQGARDPRRRDRAVPRRNERRARSRRSSRRCASSAKTFDAASSSGSAPSSRSSTPTRAKWSTRSRRASSTSCCTSRPCA